jgi:hypothetical protein
MAPDWAAIEREFRADQLSIAAISRLHGVTPATITKRARRDGWQRDLSDAVSQAIRRSLSDRSVASPVRDDSDGASPPEPAAPKSPTVRTADKSKSGGLPSADRRAVETAAARGVRVIRSHRTDIARLRRIAKALARRLEHLVAEEASSAPLRARAKGRESPEAALSRLAQVTARIVALERDAFGLPGTGTRPAGKSDAREASEHDGSSDEDKRRELARLVGAAFEPGAPPGA